MKDDRVLNGSMLTVPSEHKIDLIIKIQNMGKQDLNICAIYQGAEGPDKFIPNDIESGRSATIATLEAGKTRNEEFSTENDKEQQTFTIFYFWKREDGKYIGGFQRTSFYLNVE